MKQKIKFIFLVFSLFFIFSFQINAAPVATESASKPLLPQMIGNKNVVITDSINRDLIVGGELVSLDAPILGSVYVAGGEVNIKNTIDQNLIVAGGTVNIYGTVNKNVIVAGGQVNIQPSAIINGYVLGAANQISIMGKVNGPVKIGSETFNLSKEAVVDGDLEIYSRQINVDSNAKVSGEKRITQIETPEKENKALTKGISLTAHLISFLSRLVILFFVVKIFGEKIINNFSSTLNKPFPILISGFIYLIVVPLVSILLLFTVIGIPLALIIGLIYILSIYLSTLVSSVLFGNWLVDKKWINNKNIYLQSIIGFFLLFVVGLIPIVGSFLKFVIVVFGIGIISQSLKSLFK